MTEKTEEQMAARIAELETEKSALKTKNSELIDREKTAKARADEADRAREEAAEKAERDTKDVEALEKRLTAKFQKDVDKLTIERDAALSQLRTTLVDNEIAKAIRDNNVREGMDDALTALFKSKHKFENGEATIEGQTIGKFIGSYIGSEVGAMFRRPSDNSGVDATGSTTKPPIQHGFTKDNFKSKEGEWMVLAGRDPVTAKQAALDAGRADLASTL